MIDFIKIEILDFDLIDKISRNDLLVGDNHTVYYNKVTGENIKTINSKYRNLRFAIQTDEYHRIKRMYISGSLHYYFNNGFHNANDFTYVNFLNVLKHLKDNFGITSEKCILKSLEYGLNIIPDIYQTRKILQNMFYHQRKKFTEPINKPYKQSGNLRKNDFIIKIYDKSYQFPEYSDGELLRVEIKYGRMRPLTKMGITLLSDLLLKENHLKLYNALQKSLSEILFYDYSINPNKLSPTKQQNIINYANINYWDNILIDIKNKTLNRKNFDYHKKRLKNIIFESSDNILEKLSQVIDSEKGMLLNLPDINVVKTEIVYPIYTSLNSQKCTPYTYLYIGSIHPTNHKHHISNISKPSASGNSSRYVKAIEEYNSIKSELITAPYYGESKNNSFTMVAPYIGDQEESIIPDYDEFHSNIREIPF